jgi:phospholipase/carboxylesterase
VSADPPVEIEPRGKADATIVLLHGLGADGHDFESLVPELDLPGAPAIRWVFPQAPVRPVSINGGARMRAWYDIRGLDGDAAPDEDGIRQSAAAASALVRRENERGVTSDRVVLAGFSQGGAIALFAGLRHPERLGGILALSTYLPLDETLAKEAHPANAAVRVLIAHGRFDPVVPLAMGKSARDVLAARGVDVDFRTYPMPHSLCPQEVVDLRAWLLEVLPPQRG